MYHIYINYTMSYTSSHTWSFASMLTKILQRINRSRCVEIACTICINTSLAKWMRYLVGKKIPVWFFYCFANTNLYLFQSITSEVHYLVYTQMKLSTSCKLHAYHQNFKTFKRVRENMYLHVTFFTIDGI